MSKCFTGINLDALLDRFNVYDFFGPKPKFTKRLRLQPNNLVHNMITKALRNESDGECHFTQRKCGGG